MRGHFIIDDHNLKIITWRAVIHAGISGADVGSIMLESVEICFGGMRATTPVGMRADNDLACIARKTRTFSQQLGLKPCFTAIRSPQSNGISEALKHTLKRDTSTSCRPAPSR